MRVKFGTEEGTLGPRVPSSVPNFTSMGATCRPCGAKKPQNQPQSGPTSNAMAVEQNVRGARAAFKVPQMSVQEFVTGARLTIVRPPDALAEGHLNNAPFVITLGLIAVA